MGSGHVLLAIALAVVASWLLYRAASPKRSPRTPAARRAAAWRELVRLTHDRAAAERLFARMRERHPDAGELQLVEFAIADLRADRRR